MRDDWLVEEMISIFFYLGGNRWHQMKKNQRKNICVKK